MLQKQIIEALKADDDDLYSLLKSQWAHRFGVESLEELNNLDLKELNQNSINLDNQKIEQSQENLIENDKQTQENLIENDKQISIEDDDHHEKEIKIKKFDSIKDENNQTVKSETNEIVDKVIYENKAINPIKERQNQLDVQKLIPLPPKPKYSYLRKWLLR